MEEESTAAEEESTMVEEEESTAVEEEEHKKAVEPEGSTAEEVVADKPSVAEEEGKASVEARKASAEEVAEEVGLEVAAQEGTSSEEPPFRHPYSCKRPSLSSTWLSPSKSSIAPWPSNYSLFCLADL